MEVFLDSDEYAAYCSDYTIRVVFQDENLQFVDYMRDCQGAEGLLSVKERVDDTDHSVGWLTFDSNESAVKFKLNHVVPERE